MGGIRIPIIIIPTGEKGSVALYRREESYCSVYKLG